MGFSGRLEVKILSILGDVGTEPVFCRILVGDRWNDTPLSVKAAPDEGSLVGLEFVSKDTFPNEIVHVDVDGEIAFTMKICSGAPSDEKPTVLATADQVLLKNVGQNRQWIDLQAEVHVGGVSVEITYKARFLPMIVGKVKVKLFEGKDLPVGDRNGFSDPYGIISIGPLSKTKYQTSVIRKTLDPVWNEEFPFRANGDWECSIEVWDWDKFSHDDFLGSVNVHSDEWATVPDEMQEKWFDLTESDGKKQGKLRIGFTFYPAEQDIETKRVKTQNDLIS